MFYTDYVKIVWNILQIKYIWNMGGLNETLKSISCLFFKHGYTKLTVARVPDKCGSAGWALSRRPIRLQFDSCLGHKSGLRARSLFAGV